MTEPATKQIAIVASGKIEARTCIVQIAVKGIFTVASRPFLQTHRHKFESENSLEPTGMKRDRPKWPANFGKTMARTTWLMKGNRWSAGTLSPSVDLLDNFL